MDRKKFDLMYYFAKLLGIETLGELAEYKKMAKCETNDELLDNLYKSVEFLEFKWSEDYGDR